MPAKCNIPEISTQVSGVLCHGCRNDKTRPDERSIKPASWKPAYKAMMAMTDFHVITIRVGVGRARGAAQ